MNPTPRHILVVRFSALGDVAMTVPVIKNVLQQNPGLEITYVSVPFLAPLFTGIERLHFFPADIKNEYNGISGLYALSKKIKKEIHFDAIADLHNVLRTKLLRFFLYGKPTAIIDKGRTEKQELVRPAHKIMRPLKTMFQRYADVFTKLGINVKLNAAQGTKEKSSNTSLLPFAKQGHTLIGIAPFAKHHAKMYPLHKMLQVIELLLAHEGNRIIFFSTPQEATLLIDFAVKHENVFIAAGKYNFEKELQIISQLDVMISMDSANMHFASLYGVRCISVWGGTHPFLGFYGWGQDEADLIQTDLPCRPSSVFGNKDCPVHGVAGCMQEITPEMIADKVNNKRV